MRLTRKKAIEITEELWTVLAETGGTSKRDVLEALGYGEMRSSCSLCEYAWRKGNCRNCPYYQKFSQCVNFGAPFRNWMLSETIEPRKKYAHLFLEQLNQL